MEELPEGLPPEVVGPRMMVMLKGRAAMVARHLTNEMVATPYGQYLILKTLEQSPIYQWGWRRGEDIYVNDNL